MKKLDPTALPPETNARFTLLVFGAVIVVTSLSLVVWEKLILGNIIEVGYYINVEVIQNLDSPRLRLYLFGTPFIMALMAAGLLGLAYLSYQRHPQRIQQKKNLRPLDPVRDRKFFESVRGLAAEARLVVMPEIQVGPGGAQDGQAFGFRHHPYLRLGSGLKALRLYADHLAEYRAVILHELAHIRNDDVQRSYFAEAVWRTLLVLFLPLVVLLSLSAIALYYSGRFDLALTRFSPIFALLTAILLGIYLSIQLGLMVSLVHFIRRGALRVREIYADWRAAQWGAMDGLVKILSSPQSERPSFWKTLARAHPRSEDRLNALRDSYQLFRVSFDLPLINGFLLGFAFGGAGTLVGLVQVSRAAGFGLPISLFFALLCIAAFSALFWMLSSTLGLQIQREALADLAENVHGLTPYLRLFPLALLFHIAFEAALYLMPYEDLQVGLLAKGLNATLFFPFWFLGITTMTWMWMCALRFFARRWLGSHAGRRPPGRKMRAITLLSTLALPVLYIPFILTRGWPAIGRENLLLAVIALVLISGLFFAFCLGCWFVVSILVQPPKCRHCGTRQKQRQAAGQLCIQCGKELAVWLFVS